MKQMARHIELGRIGENIATKWLLQHGYLVIARNYLKKWGEIDIVACQPGRRARETVGKVHFIEVKAVSYETKVDLGRSVAPASRSGGHETWRPEEKIHRNKQARLKRAIETWLSENMWKGEWQIDIAVVYLVPREKYAQIKFLENVVFE